MIRLEFRTRTQSSKRKNMANIMTIDCISNAVSKCLPNLEGIYKKNRIIIIE